MRIKTVWIEDGCIACNACETACPEVFQVNEDGCVIISEAREDGLENGNSKDRSPLKSGLGQKLADAIEEAAAGCPVEVIQFSET